MAGGRLALAMLEPVGLSLAGCALGDRSLGSLDLASLLPPDWPRIDGVLALDALEGHPFRADFGRDRLEIGSLGDLSGLSCVAARLSRQIPSVSLDVQVAVATEDSDDLWFELDNSNTGPVWLSPASPDRLGIPPGGFRRPPGARRGPPRGAPGRLVTIVVRGLGAVETPVAVRELIYDGNLGRTFVEGREMAFDLAGGSLWIGPVRPRRA